MTDPNTSAVQVSIRYTEEEYLAATRLYFWNNRELVARFIITCVLFSLGLFLLTFLFDVLIPIWIVIALIFLVCLAWFHGSLIDVPRRTFRGDPKFRDEYQMTYTDAGVTYKSPHASGSVDWSFYTGVIENEHFYLMVYGKHINSFSVIPKRAFQDQKEEAAFRELLQRHVKPTMKLSEQQTEYAPKTLEPPDWR